MDAGRAEEGSVRNRTGRMGANGTMDLLDIKSRQFQD